MSAGVPDYVDVIQDKLNDIITRLARIEERQIRTTKLVEAVEKEEQSQVQGSFGLTDPGHDISKEGEINPYLNETK